RWICTRSYSDPKRLRTVFEYPLCKFARSTLFARCVGLRQKLKTMLIMPVTTAALNQLPPLMSPHGTALNNTLGQVAGTLGTAVVVRIRSSAALDAATLEDKDPAMKQTPPC